MKTTTATLVLLAALAMPAAAQTEQTPDYSPATLQRFVAQIPPPAPERDRNMHFYIGGVEFRAIGTKWKVGPMMPFSGTRFTTNRELPDPFALTNTAIATPFRAWRTQRQMESELRRIEATERARIKVKTK